MALVWILKIALVIVLLCVAAALATPKGRLPLALRGVRRMMRRDCGEHGSDAADRGEAVSGGKRFLAFLLVIIAIILTIV